MKSHGVHDAGGTPSGDVDRVRATPRWQRQDQRTVSLKAKIKWIVIWLIVGLVGFVGGLAIAGGGHGEPLFFASFYPLPFLLGRLLPIGEGPLAQNVVLCLAVPQYPALAIAGLFARRKATLVRIVGWYAVVSVLAFAVLLVLRSAHPGWR